MHCKCSFDHSSIPVLQILKATLDKFAYTLYRTEEKDRKEHESYLLSACPDYSTVLHIENSLSQDFA